MPTIAIVGAGPGLGLSIAEVFGGHGYDVALISRDAGRLGGLVDRLAADGIAAAAFPADAADHDQLTAALGDAAARFGGVDVLEYSPHAGLVQVAPQEVTVENLQPQLDQLLHGAVAATRAVLPAMLAAGAGSLLFTTGGGAVDPYPRLATVNIAQAGLRNWVLNLHRTLAGQGVYAGLVAIDVFIGASAPEGVPHLPPGEIAPVYWDLHTRRDRAEHHVGV